MREARSGVGDRMADLRARLMSVEGMGLPNVMPMWTPGRGKNLLGHGRPSGIRSSKPGLQRRRGEGGGKGGREGGCKEDEDGNHLCGDVDEPVNHMGMITGGCFASMIILPL